MHRHATSFTVRTDDGQLLFEKIEVDCDYQNDTPFPLSFGENPPTTTRCASSPAATIRPGPWTRSPACFEATARLVPSGLHCSLASKHGPRREELVQHAQDAAGVKRDADGGLNLEPQQD